MLLARHPSDLPPHSQFYLEPVYRLMTVFAPFPMVRLRHLPNPAGPTLTRRGHVRAPSSSSSSSSRSSRSRLRRASSTDGCTSRHCRCSSSGRCCPSCSRSLCVVSLAPFLALVVDLAPLSRSHCGPHADGDESAVLLPRDGRRLVARDWEQHHQLCHLLAPGPLQLGVVGGRGVPHGRDRGIDVQERFSDDLRARRERLRSLIERQVGVKEQLRTSRGE